jgi:AraC-like DNA-binding protein
MLGDNPAVPEWILELPVLVAPEHLAQRLTYLGARGEGLRKDRLGVFDIERENDRRPADRRRREHAHLRKLVGQMQIAGANVQLHRHQPPVGGGDPTELLRAERVRVEGDGALGALNDDMGRDDHGPSVNPPGAAAVLDVLAPPYDGRVTDDQVRMWRPSKQDRVPLMASRTTSCQVEPRGEYVLGIVAGQPMRFRRNHERRIVQPGQVVAWDPSGAHAGTAVGGRPWSSRLMVIEVADLATIAGDEESVLAGDISFPDPIVSDAELAREFLALHHTLEKPSTRLERDERLGEWLRTLIERTSAARPPPSSLSPHDDRALRLACDYLGDHPTRNVSLDELAAVGGIGKFRLIRIFRERTGLLHTPCSSRTASATRAASSNEARLSPTPPPPPASPTKSHLHRHFQRSLGLTPAAYQRHIQA